jgi:hypothetical protein
MRDLESVGKELDRLGKTQKLKSIANSPDGQRISQMLDAKAVEKAAKSGDTDALRGILGQVLSTDEGRRLAESLKKVMEE